jgi:Flp pilus assembly protein TadD
MSEHEGTEWVMINMDEAVARKQGMPFQIPLPKENFEGLADEGLTQEKVRAWIKGFLEDAPVAKDGNWRRRNSTLVSQLEGYVDKFPLWDKAQKLFQEHQFEKALKTLKRVTVMCPDDHAARMNYASALANQRDYDKAFKQFRQIRDTFDGEPEFHVSFAQVQIMRGKEEEAIEQLLKALEAKPDHLPAMDALSKLGLLTKLYEDPRDAGSLTYVRSDALADYLAEQWDSAERDVAFYLEQLGYHQSEGRAQVALLAAERALAVAGSEGSEPAELGRVKALRSLERLDEAVAAAKAAAEKYAGSSAAQVELAGALGQAGDNEAANQAIEQALELDPGDQQALVSRFWPPLPPGTNYGENLAGVQDALPKLEAWSQKHPESAGALRSFARAMLLTGAEDPALDCFAKATALAPEDDDLRAEWWGELAKALRYQEVIDDSKKVDSLGGRDWKLRWNEAEAYSGLEQQMQARACFMQLNADLSLHADVRKRAKRAAQQMGSKNEGAAG